MKTKRIKKTADIEIKLNFVKTWIRYALPNALDELLKEAEKKQSYKEELIDNLFEVCRGIGTALNQIKAEGANNANGSSN